MEQVFSIEIVVGLNQGDFYGQVVLNDDYQNPVYSVPTTNSFNDKLHSRREAFDACEQWIEEQTGLAPKTNKAA